jgi:hypothetical protein
MIAKWARDEWAYEAKRWRGLALTGWGIVWALAIFQVVMRPSWATTAAAFGATGAVLLILARWRLLSP